MRVRRDRRAGRDILAIVCMASLIGSAALGCGGGDDGPPASLARAPVAAPRLDRPELAVWRYSQLARSRPNGGGVRVLVGDPGGEGFVVTHFEPASWSPDGTRLAFTAQLAGVADSDTDIYAMRADGSRRRRLTSGGDSFHPVWAPDGRWIYFAREGREAGSEEFGGTRHAASIWAMRPDGSEQRAIMSPGDDHYDIPGSFSPDGSLLAFTRGRFAKLDEQGRQHNTREVWAVRPDGSHARRLAKRAQDPAFSPDGRLIAFASDRDENGDLTLGDRVFFTNELYLMGADGSRPRRLTHTRALNELQPSWIPSGTRIAYQRGEDFQSAEVTSVMQANADGSCARPILVGRPRGPWYAAPTWRPGDARRGDQPLRC
jgi:Tol biopolymer transport system component